MNKSISIIVNEYVLDVDVLNFTIKGRIVKTENGEFRWEISHYYKLGEDDVGVYIPSTITCKSLDDAETNLKWYMNSFTAIGVESNKKY